MAELPAKGNRVRAANTHSFESATIEEGEGGSWTGEVDGERCMIEWDRPGEPSDWGDYH